MENVGREAGSLVHLSGMPSSVSKSLLTPLLLIPACQGERISVEKGINEAYRLKVNPGQESIPWRTQVVMRDLPIEQLPKNQAQFCQVGLSHQISTKSSGYEAEEQTLVRIADKILSDMTDSIWV
jgi:hypothetical protein